MIPLLNNVYQSYEDDVDAVASWCDSVYASTFGEYFEPIARLFERMQSKDVPITDAELSEILIDLPLTLFSVSESLNKMRLNYEVVKLKQKQNEYEISQDPNTPTKHKSDYVASKMLEHKLLILAYTTIINRVESEISFCRELIMGAKKIWDGRKRGELVNPVSPTSESAESLPEYHGKSYIKGGS